MTPLRLALPLLLGACADQNAALLPDLSPPPPFTADLHSTPWIPGQAVTMTLRHGAPNDNFALVIGRPGLACPPVLQGECADLTPLARPVIARGTTDAAGNAVVSVTLPSRLSTGVSLRVQVFGGLTSTVWKSSPWDGVTVASCPGSPACNLLANPHVDAWVEPWDRTPPANFDLTWEAADHNGDPGSGSMLFTNNWGGNYSSAWQCVRVAAGEVYDYGGWGYMPSATSAGARMFAEYIAYSGPDCTGNLVSFAESTWDPTLDAWAWLGLTGFTIQPGTGSLRVGHGVINFGGDHRSAYFDDLELVRR
ncbi:MAG TPA: hypothetical protein PKA64_19825 [Myxococcota bacterium]|nr:hypothetical protein [Myxococcota bacterium]